MTKHNGGIGGRLRIARKKCGLTLDDVADKLDMTKAGVGHWETGRNQPTAEQIGFLAQLYQVSCDYLLLGLDAAEFDADVLALAKQIQQLDQAGRRSMRAHFMGWASLAAPDERVAKALPLPPGSSQKR